MKWTAPLLAGAVFSTSLALRLPAVLSDSFSEQLLDIVDESSSPAAVVSALRDSIEKSSGFLDTAGSPRTCPSQPAARARLACQMLKQVLPKYYTDSTSVSAYSTLRNKNWSSNCDLAAACYIAPEDAIQVAIALQIISRAKSKFAVRSGGHNPNPGFAGVGEEGVTIDTQGFTTLKLSADKSTATVGAGLRFGAVQTYLDSQGVAVVSGRNKDVGVAGLLLGGGHPIINSLTGLAADNIQSVEVVLSSGEVVKASRWENGDLLRALKGGGNNFGIVTNFQLKTAQPRSIWYRIAVYNNSDPRAVFDAFATVQRNMEADPKAGIQMTASPVGFTVAFVYGEHTNDPKVFAPFKSLAPANETKPATNGTTLEFINLQSPPQPEASRDTVGVTTYLDTDLYVDIYNKYLAAAKASGGPTTVFLLPIQTFGSASAIIAERNGGNVLGTSKRAQTWWNPIAQWTNPADDAKVHKTLLDLADSIKAAAQAKGVYDRYIFANIAARDQKLLASYGQQNVDFMRSVSREYDALGTFQQLQNGGFLLSRA